MKQAGCTANLRHDTALIWSW